MKIFKYLNKQQVDIACLHEPHYSSSSCPNYFDAQYPQFFLANGPIKQKGVLIALRNSVPFSFSKWISDPNGRYLLLQGTIQNIEVTILTYYAPNVDPWPFLTHICSLLMSHQRGALLLAGDSNVMLSLALDKYPSKHVSPSPDSKKFSHSLQSCDLLDLWKELHPLGKDYTHYFLTHHSPSIIDHMFMVWKYLPLVVSASCT